MSGSRGTASTLASARGVTVGVIGQGYGWPKIDDPAVAIDALR